MTSPSALADVTVGYSSLVPRLSGIPLDQNRAGAALLVIAQTGEDSDLPPHASADEDLPEALVRLEAGGAAVQLLRSRGVAKSRNEALRRATTRYLLFCDDDVTVDVDGLTRAVEHMRATGIALAYGRAVDEHGAFRKRYAAEVTPLTMYNSGKAATYEMVVDVDQVRAAGVWFDERFGAGADLYLGDEYIFIADLLRAGLTADAVPFTLAMHPSDSSGARWNDGVDLAVRAAALERAFQSRAIAQKAAFAWKNRGRFPSWRAVRDFVFTAHGGTA